MRLARNTILTLIVGLAAVQPSLLQAQTAVAPTFQSAVNDICTIAIAAGMLVAGMVGLVGVWPDRIQAESGRYRFDDRPDLCHCWHPAGLLSNTFIT
jgi:hypothetical protein